MYNKQAHGVTLSRWSRDKSLHAMIINSDYAAKKDTVRDVIAIVIKEFPFSI